MATKTAAGKKKAFGGYAVNFNGATESLETVFGKKPISPAEMTKVLWAYVKKKKIGGKD
ncbi:MAG: hypothetical protein MPW14_06525 [Candidatus Manganitrophus sp.]|nr:hypothetical protein [Candidatus Manganitrophus morganii]MDC4204421.1 hypothetical protein [Candidatus Manganitrophus sp.]MCG3115397.1 hypothetical protein [Candidatus Manganitrophus morganii]WDT71297.1 MAG: hypothetical protein MPW17_00095 [Candidatus Manganitrophus sp.]WDT76452.1 MAG: hypothetical protein MPW16_04395 [Candidatus Manganitrophus sp.]